MDVLTDDNMIGMKKRFAGFAGAMLIFNSIGFNIDWIGHVGGFLSGMLLMWYINKIDQIVMNLSEMKIYRLKSKRTVVKQNKYLLVRYTERKNSWKNGCR